MLTAEQWDQVQSARGTGSSREVGKRFGLSDGVVCNIWNGSRRRPGWVQERTRQRKEQERETQTSWQPWVRGNGVGEGNRCGLTTVERVDLYHSQNDLCYMCEQPLNFDESNVDHDHSHKDCDGCPKCVRGLAHALCNTGAGQFNDNPTRMRLAADNLERAIKEVRSRW